MTTKITDQIEEFIKSGSKEGLPRIKPGDTVKVYQKFKEKGKDKVQIFEGTVIAKKHGKEIGASITVRKMVSGVGVEKIFPLHSPLIDKLEIVSRRKVRRAKLYYLKSAKGKKTRLKQIEIRE